MSCSADGLPQRWPSVELGARCRSSHEDVEQLAMEPALSLSKGERAEDDD